MSEYEMMLLTSAELDADGQSAILKRAEDTVTKNGGTWGKVEDWGRRKMAYPINKIADANYTLAFFEAPGDINAELAPLLRITDGVMRVMVVNKVPDMPEGNEMPKNDDDPPAREERAGRGGRGGGGGGRGRDRDRG